MTAAAVVATVAETIVAASIAAAAAASEPDAPKTLSQVNLHQLETHVLASSHPWLTSYWPTQRRQLLTLIGTHRNGCMWSRGTSNLC